ncbi:MAG: DeoR family transcriptional regulator [Rubrivivax sp. SCN 70-15]|nr:MAG: DeoR family transcriptional regulator [Rubrivivax sp. SCN 70-15]
MVAIDELGSGSRVDRILERVRRQGFQSVENLAQQFGVTTQTIRRDVNLLCERGLCRRRHGGIDMPPVAENMAYAQRQVLNHDAKLRIARCVACLVPDEASLFLGIGTTPEQCARALVHKRHLRVMTNNLHAALALSCNPSCELTIAGGRLRNLDCDVIAGEAHGFFRSFAVDIGIYGVGGVGDDGSLLDFDHDEAHMRGELERHCRQRFLVLDRSKFGRGATVRAGHITEASVVFTDGPVPPAIEELLSRAGVRLVVANADTESAATPVFPP